MSTSKMAHGLVRELGLDAGTAESVARSQKACVLCGHGLIVYPWGDVTPQAERVVLEARGADGLSRQVPIHAGCLSEVSAGSAIAVALGFAEPEV